MRKLPVTFAIGLLFGAGLAVSRMINPERVLGFLDFAGDWDPTLAFVMAGALAVSVPGYLIARRRSSALLGGAMQIPTRNDIDWKLVLGATLFGIGWGLVGFCPGPAIAALSAGLMPAFVFAAAMLAGMAAYRLIP
jgi:uncharacterized membrane protein YedE/YeeE